MDDSETAGLRKLVGQHNKIVYEAVKAGTVAQLSPENQVIARAIQEHMHLKHVHNALEFADLREGEPYKIMVEGNPVSPMAHVTSHAAVKGQIEADPLVRAAFEKMVATGTSAHHAEHVLCAMFMELFWDETQAVDAGGDPEKAKSTYYRKIKKLTRDSAFRKKTTRKFRADHFVFE
jgi:hypothetical protein